MSTNPERNGPGADESRSSASDREVAELAQVVTRRAIRRLDILEWVILVAGAGLALLGGAIVAWLLRGMAGWDFRVTWVVASVLLFVVPGTIAVIRIKREEREHARRMAETRVEEGDDG
ncbi:MAG: hypothetical protein R3304_04295 [Longimicrobiales bacterium]|nr:hypothetical protein [Longimicrobiales bacterium]